MRPSFGREYVEDEFRRVGEALSAPLSVYLIGGGALALRDRKAATKDIDIVVEDGHAFSQLWDVLGDLGYEAVQSLGADYRDLGAACCVENDDGCRFDVFNRQVADKLVLSEGMRARSEPYIDTQTLSVSLVSDEDVFLIKSIAGRDEDVEDMAVLVQAGLEFEVIREELTVQINRLGDDRFVTYANEALLDLESGYGVTTPLHEHVQELTERYYRGLEVLHALDEPKRIADLAADLGVDADAVAERIEYLEQFDRVTREDGLVRRDGD